MNQSDGSPTSSAPATPEFVVERGAHDVVVAGGGMAGIAAAVTAARHGAHCALIQDRPVLGGNASKEIRVWLGGAEGGGNARWFRETGLMEELLLENQSRNPEGSAEIWDTILLDLVLRQERLALFLNTTLCAADLTPSGTRIRGVRALTLNCEKLREFTADYFIDCTGDGTLGLLAGAPFMTGSEGRGEFGESMAPAERRPCTMGASILFSAKDAGQPVAFHAPHFAYKLTEKDFRIGRYPARDFDQYRWGCWWVEYGGKLDTVHDNEAIKFELLKIAYGVFDWLKNDPAQREKNKNLALEWIGAVPGKRESRRFIGAHVLTQQDIQERRAFPDAVAFGGWNLDDHPPAGFYADEEPCVHTYIPDIYSIPLRSLYSKALDNLFFAGRNASVSHVALSSTRVMRTCAQMGEAAGAAAVLCLQKKLSPGALANGPAVRELQEALLRDDHYIIGLPSRDPANLAQAPGAGVRASSQMPGALIERAAGARALDDNRMVLFPVSAGPLPYAEVLLTAATATQISWRLHGADGRGGVLPARVLAEGTVRLEAGNAQWVRLPLEAAVPERDWCMLELARAPGVSWHFARERLPGIRSYEAPGWDGNPLARFRPLAAEENYCFRLPPDARLYGPANITNGLARPFRGPNLWASAPSDFRAPEWLELAWGRAVSVREVVFVFDSDLDRAIVNIVARAPHRVVPDLVKDYDVELRQGGRWTKALEVRDNYFRRRAHTFASPVQAGALRLVVRATNGAPRAQVYEVWVY